jgi:hypothetical protein
LELSLEEKQETTEGILMTHLDLDIFLEVERVLVVLMTEV